MECKDNAPFNSNSQQLVLIETLWNVKNPQNLPEVNHKDVLIETLWNVKEHIDVITIITMMY